MDYYGNEFAAGLAAIAGIFIVVLLIMAIVGIALYILGSIGLMTLANNRGIPNAWLAWIPIAGSYTLGAVADDINEKEGGKSYFRWILLGGQILSMIIGSVSSAAMTNYMGNLFSMIGPYTDPEMFGSIIGRSLASSSVASSFGWILSTGMFVVTIIVLNRIFKCYKPESSTAWTVLCVFFCWLLQPIFLMVIRNRRPNWINPPYQGGPGGGYNAPPAGQPWQQNNMPPQGGYYPPPQGGYNPPPQGGYNPPPQGGYNPPPQGGYNPPPQGGYTSPVQPSDPLASRDGFIDNDNKGSAMFDNEPKDTPLKDDDKPADL